MNYSDSTLNQMAQRFYEVASADGEVMVRRMVGSKAAIVDGLRAAIELGDSIEEEA